MKRKRAWSLLTLLLLYTATLAAQSLDEQVRRWAISGSWGGNWPIVAKNTTSGKVLSSASQHTLKLEYYIPATRFSIKGGYLGEEIRMGASDVTASLSQIELGGRYYLLPQRFMVQPYCGLSAACNLSPRTDEGVIAESSYNPVKQEYQQIRQCRYAVREPLFSIAPSVGADIYFLSCFAFTVEYDFRLGIDGRMKGEITSVLPGQSGTVQSNGMRQGFMIGVKVNFPFTFTQKDGSSILNWLDDLIYGNN